MIWLDTETYNDAPIKHGTYKYTSTCEPMIVTWAYNDGPVRCWDATAGEPMPADLDYLLDDPSEPISAHAAMFDRNVLRYGLKRDIPITRWRCTMVKAMAHGMPGGLDLLCDILKIPTDLAKHKAGRTLLMLFCKPRPKNSALRRATAKSHPAEWQEFLSYAGADITAMREVDRKLPTWNWRPEDIAMWHLDQVINDRGLCVDVPFAEAAIAAVAREQKRLAKRTQDNTNEAVQSATQRDQMLIHIVKEYGIELPDLQMDTLERRIADLSLPVELRELLAIRLQASSTSTSKYNSLLRGVQPDGRLRGTLQFNGAARTRRPAGRMFQPTNLPRPDLKNDEIDFAIDTILAGAEDLIFPDVMRVARNAVRGAIIAPPGKKLTVADLANIEGREGAWFGGEAWKLQAFMDNDAGIGPDLYVVAYSKAFGVEPEVVIRDKEQGTGLMRQIGKVMELMLQYEGGVGAWVTGAITYGIDLDKLAEVAFPSIPADVLAEAKGMYDWTIKQKRPTFGLSEQVFIVLDSLKRMWRRQQPGIVTLWADLKETAAKAICQPGNTFTCGLLKIRRDAAWLRIQLPSGNALCYPSPRIDDGGGISYMGINNYTKKWQRIGTYGGKFLENICQGFAGDLLRHNWPAIEAAGYEIVLTVYDEDVTETPDTPEFNATALAKLVATVPPYATGLPLSAAGFEAYRYRKG